MSDQYRRTGRTTRAIARAVEAALRGGRVAFVMPTEQGLRQIAPMIDTMLHERGCTRSHRCETTTIVGAGEILLVTLARYDERVAGIGEIAPFYDHTCSHAVAQDYRNARERLTIARQRASDAQEATKRAEIEEEAARNAVDDARHGLGRAQNRLHEVVAQDESFEP